MTVSQIVKSPVATEVLEAVRRDVLHRTGLAVAFYDADGSPVQADVGAVADPLAPLVAEALRTHEDCLQANPDGLRAAWPIRIRSQTVLVAAALLPRTQAGRSETGRRLLAAVADILRARIEAVVAQAEGQRIAESLSQSFEEVSLLHSLSEVLRINQPVAELLQHVCRQLAETVEAESAVAYLPAESGEMPQTVVAGRLPLAAADLPRIVDHLLDGVGTEPFVLINNHVSDDPLLAAVAPGLRQTVVVPFQMGDGLRGALAAFNRLSDEFGSADVKLIRSIAGTAAIFIDNRRLYQDLRRMMLDLVRALVSSVDAKDPYTSGHSERVAITGRQVARQLHLSDDEIEHVYLAGLLHDIGKIGTPEHILRKEGRLDPDERRIIQQHSEIGGRILAGIRRLEPIREAVLYHHERTDGSGYPAGLKGDAIPLLARIVGLADAFDAMMSNRPYRPVLPLDEVKREIERNAGTQFDLRAADALLGLDFNRLLRLFAERLASGDDEPTLKEQPAPCRP